MELYVIALAIFAFTIGLTIGISVFYAGFRLGYRIKDKVIHDIPLDEEVAEFNQDATD